MAPKKSPKKIELFYLCLEDDVINSVSVLPNATSWDIKEAVELQEPLFHTIWLVPPSSIKISREVFANRSSVRSALREKFECVEDLVRLLSHNHEEWLRQVQVDELHLVIRHVHYPIITLYDVATRECVKKKEVLPQTMVENILPSGKQDYSVYRFPEGTKSSPPDALKDAVDSHPVSTLQKIDRDLDLHLVSPWGFARQELHFVIVAPDFVDEDEDEERDTLQALPFKEQRLWYFESTPPAAPSSQAQKSQFQKAQKTKGQRIYCGRPHQHTTPPSLLDETLCQLRYNIQSIAPTPKDIQCYDALRLSACKLFAEEKYRREEFTDILTEAGVFPAHASRRFIGSTDFHDDGDIRAPCLGGRVILYVQEIKNEIGTTKADPYVEAIYYWIENVRTFLKSPIGQGVKADQINFPAVLVLQFGPYLAIAAAVYGRDPIVEHIGCVSLHAHLTNDPELAAGERAIAALRVALHSLQERYPVMPPNADHAPTSPSATSTRVFRVVEDGTPLCVKFSKRYSSEAHQVACDAGIAPALRAVNVVCDWIMIVMDDITAEYSNTMWDFKYGGKKTGRKAKPQKEHAAQLRVKPAVSLEEVQKQVEAILKVLHAKGWVHADVRDCNVLMRNEDASAEKADFQIVDWDWAGRLGEVKYPRAINRGDIIRPPNALAGEAITAEDDMWMASQLSRY
ncbi:hypothetical protein C8Q74DRAFT_1257736 [Fomes fomentarius]|nr:hypothetical protein C8Q74DRAFT_1257736 [Fomes fomentarius]